MTTAVPATEPSAPAKTEHPAPRRRRNTSVHPIAIEIGLLAMLWFIVVSWLCFAWGGGVDFDLAIITLFCAIFVTLFLSQASRAAHDQRWRLRQESFRSFLRDDNVAIDRGTMRGRDVLIEVTLIPVTLALGATLIGLAWVIFG